jgi:hypothetical protein
LVSAVGYVVENGGAYIAWSGIGGCSGVLVMLRHDDGEKEKTEAQVGSKLMETNVF